MLCIDKYSCLNNTYLGQHQVCNAPNMYTSLPFPSLSRTQYFSVCTYCPQIQSSVSVKPYCTLQVTMRVGDGRGQWAGFEREEWNKSRFLKLMRGKDGVRKVLECDCTVSTGVLTASSATPSDS